MQVKHFLLAMTVLEFSAAVVLLQGYLFRKAGESHVEQRNYRLEKKPEARTNAYDFISSNAELLAIAVDSALSAVYDALVQPLVDAHNLLKEGLRFSMKAVSPSVAFECAAHAFM